MESDDPGAFERALRDELARPGGRAAFERFEARLLSDDDRVRSGPFTGMHIGGQRSWGHVACYLLGAYERELHHEFEALIATGYDVVIDVGCAEGYYAVGLARRLPGAVVHAFDIDEDARRICAETAALNGVADRVVVGGECGPEELAHLVSGRTLLFVDCEGCELHLLDPQRSPELAAVDIVVELHDFVDPTITATVLERFEASHDLKMVDVAPRDPGEYPDLAGESPMIVFTALVEARPTDPHPMQWAVLRSRRPGDPG